MACSSSAVDLDCVRGLVRQSRFAVGLVALKDGVFVELSPAAATVTGLDGADDAPVDIGVIAADQELVVSMRAVAHDADQPYAIALFSSSEAEERAEQTPTIETLLGPLRDLNEPGRRSERREIRLAPETFPGLEDLTDRQGEILRRLLDGDRVTTMSRGMHLSASTIRNHLSALYRKVGVHSQAELIERLHAYTA
jgi:DNA-binding CsgD family transcriptional regulator